MYAWIWRILPGGWAGKLLGSLGLLAAACALLWYVVFPWAEPLLPFDDVQVTQDDSGVQTPGPGDSAQPGPAVTGGTTLGDHDVPYSTESDNPAPSVTLPR